MSTESSKPSILKFDLSDPKSPKLVKCLEMQDECHKILEINSTTILCGVATHLNLVDVNDFTMVASWEHGGQWIYDMILTGTKGIIAISSDRALMVAKVKRCKIQILQSYFYFRDIVSLGCTGTSTLLLSLRNQIVLFDYKSSTIKSILPVPCLAKRVIGIMDSNE